MREQIAGIYEKTLFRDERTASTIFSVRVSGECRAKNKFGCVVCIGTIPAYQKGMPLLIEGIYRENEKYGLQMMLERVKEYIADDATAIEYLVSGGFEGVSYAAARELVAKYGANIFEFVQRPQAAQRISSGLRKLSRQNAQRLFEKIQAVIKQREFFEYMLHFDVAWPTVERLFNAYGAESLARIKSDPYGTGMKHGLDFYTCDQISKSEGFYAADERRLLAVAKSALKQLASAGHVYAPRSEVCRAANRILKKGSFQDVIPVSLIESAIEKHPDIVVENDADPRVYMKSLYEAEISTANNISRLMKTRKTLPFDDSVICYAQRMCGRSYTGDQQRTFQLLRQSGVAILTGGPGTGKTTCVSGLLAAYEKMLPRGEICLCAPTGRAAQKLTESTGREAVTIHRLLECRPDGSRAANTMRCPLTADLIVVDEGSMLSIMLADMLFSSVKSGALVLIVGDINQLPSVEAGDVLHDLIYSGLTPTCHLSKIHRQAANSPIIRNADLINAGFYDLDEDGRFEILQQSSADAIANSVLTASKRLYNPQKPFDTQVLAPIYKTSAGVVYLNTLLQAVLNPRGSRKELKYGDKVYREMDKVILLSNNYTIGYCNGDIGIIVEVGASFVTVQLGKNRRICIGSEMLDDIDLAYCVSVHKSQGSEFENVILALPYVQNLSKNLLYTGVTRARERMVLIPQHGAVFTAIQNDSTGQRHSMLIDRLHGSLKLCA